MSVVFLSYDRENGNVAEALAEDIQALGHTVWFDEELAGGQQWWDKILATIRNCDVFVYVLTPRATRSAACQREHEYAVTLGKPVLPVLSAEGVSANLLPPTLALIQFVDYRNRDRGEALRLARAFAALPPASPLPEPLPDPPAVPSSYLSGLARRLATSDNLSYEQQSSILLDLKGSLQDPETAEDARSLLKQMRRRRDLLASIAGEIDLVMGQMAPVSGQLSLQGATSASSSAPGVPETAGSSPSAEIGGPPWIERLRVGLAGALIGMTVGFLSMPPSPYVADNVIGAVVGGIPGAVAGAIAGKRPKMVLAALFGAVAMFLVVWGWRSYHSVRDALALGALYAPLGAVFGVLIRLTYVRMRQIDWANTD